MTKFMKQIYQISSYCLQQIIVISASNIIPRGLRGGGIKKKKKKKKKKKN